MIPVGVKADPSLWRNAWTRLGRERRHGQVETYGNWYDSANLGKLSALKKLAPEAMAGFEALDRAALADGAIPKKYKELMPLAVALTTQCPYCLEVHREAAKQAGATETELAETVFIAMALRAGAALTHGTHLMPHQHS